MSKPIFLYLKAAPLAKSDLRKIQNAGYIAIAVETFDSVKIAEPLPIGNADKISKAAYETLGATLDSQTVQNFGRKVAKALSAQGSGA